MDFQDEIKRMYASYDESYAFYTTVPEESAPAEGVDSYFPDNAEQPAPEEDIEQERINIEDIPY
jgi:hypothetical protein